MSFTFLQQGPKIPLWVTTSTSVLKSHTGATQALTGVRESCFVWRKRKVVHYYRFFSVFGLWHKADFAHFCGDTTRDYQPERDEITRGLVRDVRHYVTQFEEVDKAIADFLPRFECTLNTIPGVSDTTVAKLLSEIGDIRRFPNANKLANFAGIAPVNFSSSGKGNDKPSKQGNRRLQGTIYFLAIQMIQLSSKGLPRNPAFYAYYQRQLTKGKTKPQALILISRRLISIIYGMLKNKTEYHMPKV